MQQSAINTAHTYNASIVHFANNNPYSGTVTVVPMGGSQNGGSYLGISATGALQFASVVLNGNNTSSSIENNSFGTSPIVFKSGLGSVTLGSLSGSANVVLRGYDETNHVYGTDTVALTVGGNNASTTFSGAISGSGSLTKAGSGTFVLSGSNTYSGGTRVSAGTLQLGNANALGTGGVQVNGGTLDLNGGSVAIGALSGSAGAAIGNSSVTGATLTTTVTGTSSYAGTIDGGGNPLSFVKSGSGTLALSGSLGWIGVTADTGVLQLTDSAKLASVTIGTSGTLALTPHTGAWKTIDTSSLTFSGTSGSIDLGNSAMAVLAIMAYDNSQVYLDTFAGVSGLGASDEVTGDPVDFNQALLKTTCLGDLNGDGIVDGSDYGLLDYGSQIQVYGVLNGGGAGVAQSAAAAAGSGAAPASPEAVPEPGMLGMLLAGAFGLLGRRHRKHLAK